MQGFFINDYDLSSVEAKNYVTHNMMKMVEREARDVEDSTDFLFKEIESEYTWVIGSKIADAIFPTHPTRIFDFDVVYEQNYIFDANSINFLRKK